MYPTCNVRVEFSDATSDTVLFKDDEERSFQVQVRKEQDMTLICGDGWEKFISENELIGGECIGFYLNEAVPRLWTMYISGEVEDDPFDYAYFSQRMKKLSEDETNNLFEILPPTKDYMGVSFVHHLSKTNIVTQKMKLLMKVISGLNIPGVGLAGVRLEAAGPATTVQYKTDKDGRKSFNEAGWEEFLTGK